jgi:hypothetical protein
MIGDAAFWRFSSQSCGLSASATPPQATAPMMKATIAAANFLIAIPATLFG